MNKRQNNEAKTPAHHLERELDGIYIRVCIGGHWVNRCLSDLVGEDVHEWIMAHNPERRPAMCLNVLKHLHERLRALGDHFDITAADRARMLEHINYVAQATPARDEC